MTDLMIILLHEALCMALFYSVFCRAVRSSKHVRLDVRVAFFALGLVACIGMAAPLVWGLVPSLFGLLLLGSVVIVQLVTAHHWRDGVPDRFYKAGRAPGKRRIGGHIA